MTKPFWNAARAAQHRKPHRRSTIAPVGTYAAVDLNLYDVKPCGHHDCSCAKPAPKPDTNTCPTCGWEAPGNCQPADCGVIGEPHLREHREHRAVWLVERVEQQAQPVLHDQSGNGNNLVQPAGEWTRHERCETGNWRNCWHMRGSNLHVLPWSSWHIVTARECGGRDSSNLHEGTLEDCKAWVEQHERGEQDEQLPAGWRRTEPGGECVHDSGAFVGAEHDDHGYCWAPPKADIVPYQQWKPTREEAMAAALKGTKYEV